MLLEVPCRSCNPPRASLDTHAYFWQQVVHRSLRLCTYQIDFAEHGFLARSHGDLSVACRRPRRGCSETTGKCPDAELALLVLQHHRMRKIKLLFVIPQLARHERSCPFLSACCRHPATEALVDRLTKRMTDKEKRAFLHACLEDARECTHRPRTRSAAARNGRGAEGSGDREGDEEAKGEQGAATKRDVFLYRVHAQERAK